MSSVRTLPIIFSFQRCESERWSVSFNETIILIWDQETHPVNIKASVSENDDTRWWISLSLYDNKIRRQWDMKAKRKRNCRWWIEVKMMGDENFISIRNTLEKLREQKNLMTRKIIFLNSFIVFLQKNHYFCEIFKVNFQLHHACSNEGFIMYSLTHSWVWLYYNEKASNFINCPYEIKRVKGCKHSRSSCSVSATPNKWAVIVCRHHHGGGDDGSYFVIEYGDKMKLKAQNKQNHNLLSERAALIAFNGGRKTSIIERGVNWKQWGRSVWLKLKIWL